MGWRRHKFWWSKCGVWCVRVLIVLVACYLLGGRLGARVVGGGRITPGVHIVCAAYSVLVSGRAELEIRMLGCWDMLSKRPEIWSAISPG